MMNIKEVHVNEQEIVYTDHSRFFRFHAEGLQDKAKAAHASDS